MRIGTFALLVLLVCNACKTNSIVVEETKDTYKDGLTTFIIAEDLMSAIDKAAEMNKPLFVEFVADWCLPCKLMSEEVFTHGPTAAMLNNNFVSYKCDVEKGSGPNMKMLFQVDILPTLLFLDGKGRPLARNDGSLMHNDLQSLANEALSVWDTSSAVVTQPVDVNF